MRLFSLLLLSLALSFQSSLADENPVPEFDLEKVKATYVVSLPETYDAGKKWPLIIDFHGAIAPSRKGANVTQSRVWSRFARSAPYIVVGINGRTRAWNMTRGEKNDRAYALRVLSEIRTKYSIDPSRVYLAGFSSGADFLCSGGLQAEDLFSASLVVCPGPPNVVGLRDGSLLAARDYPFLFATGEEDFIRKSGAWEAFLTLDKAGANPMYREVPKVGHAFFSIEEYVRLVEHMERMAADPSGALDVDIKEAIAREDYLFASTYLSRTKSDESRKQLMDIQAKGEALTREAAKIDRGKQPGRAYEAWWRIRTQFHRFEPLATRAQKELDAIKDSMSGRDLLRARGAWFKTRALDPKTQTRADNRAPNRQTATAGPKRPWVTPRGIGEDPRWGFQQYLTFDELTERMQELARQFPERVRLLSMGKSIEGRDLWVLEISDRSTGEAASKPAVYIQGGIHGNEISTTMTTLYLAYQFAANPGRSRTTSKLQAQTTLYVAPAVNPDAVHHFLSEPHSYWRPRFNYRPFDSDEDGKVDEDSYEDLNGDGEIGLMYQPDPKGGYILRNDRLVRGSGDKQYRIIGREGIDNDEDGRYSEDLPGGIDLNRNFPVGFGSRKQFGGFSGSKALSEPETRAIVDFVSSRKNISIFLDYHNAARCVFFWPQPRLKSDYEQYVLAAARFESQLGYEPKPLSHSGSGLSCAWAYGKLGLFGYIVELEASRPQSDEPTASWGDESYMSPKPFKHPQLGEILIGNDTKKLPKRNPHPQNILWQADRNWQWLRKQLEQLPRLRVTDPKIERVGDRFVVQGNLTNSGSLPCDSEMAAERELDSSIRLRVEGGKLSGDTVLASLDGGHSQPFHVQIEEPGENVTLVISHPRAGTARLAISRPLSPTVPIRRDYDIRDGFATPDRARLANNDFYREGVTSKERGPAFDLKHRKPKMRVAVILAEWQDLRHSIEAEEFEKAFFSEGTYRGKSSTGQQVYGSLRDFYDEMSYGNLEVTGKVFDWVELPGNYADYRNASFGSRILSDAMLRAVREKHGADALDEFDGLAFVWAGNSISRTSALWPMRLSFRQLPEKVGFKMAEYHLGEMTAIGVACHEMGHTFGVNDKYGLGANANPIGPWCLMAKGTHGNEPSGRHRPFHLCAWCKMVIGWVKPAVIDPKKPQKLALRPISFGPREAFRILLKPDGSEYLLLENRRREGFHSDLFSPGLVVLRVGPNDLPSAPQTRVKLLPAHGLPPLRRGIIAAPSQVAWPQGKQRDLECADARISNIQLVDDVIYFEVGPVENSSNVLRGTVIRKKWSKSYESWNAGGAEYFVLDVGTASVKERTAAEGVILRSSKVSAETIAKHVGKRVELRGRYKKATPYVPVDEGEQFPVDADGAPLPRGSGFLVDQIKVIP